MTTHYGTDRATLAFASDWLAAAHPVPESARREWGERHDVALLPVGRRWDAVKLPALVVHRVAGSHEADSVRLMLRKFGICGPVVVDPHRSYYALVPSGTAAQWEVRDVPCLGPACYLATPAVTRTEPPGIHWLVLPDGTGQDLSDAMGIRSLIAVAHGPRPKAAS